MVTNNIEEYKGVYVFAQQVDNEISGIALELLGKGKELAAKLETEVTAVLIGYKVKGLADKLAEYGADKVILVDDPELETYRTEPYAHALASVIEKYKPEVASIEELFFNNNAKTALQVGQARGVILLAAVNSGLPIFEYTPLQVKQSVVGYGRAAKGQIQQMTKALLSLNEIPKPDDVADALAIAICHAHSHKMVRLGVHM